MNEKAKHIPGPWDVDVYDTSYRRDVAITVWSGEDRETVDATVNLIEAAPDMLAALKKIREEAKEVGAFAILHLAGEAIEKAEGK